MGRKGKQQKSDAAASQGVTNGSTKAKAADSQLWTALKHEDEAELLELLFDEIDDAESGEVRRVQKPTARKAVSQPNAKKALPLTYAVSEGLDRTLLELLLRAGAAVNKKDETPAQSTALHAACWNEDGEAAEVLLRAGADPRVTDADGRTPLHVLATSNAANLMLQLLDSVSEEEGKGSSREKAAKEGGEEDNNHGSGTHGRQSAAPSTVLKTDPLALLGVADKVQGTTVLHLSLGESTYNFGVAQALCEYLERMKDEHAAAVAQLVSARTTTTGEAPLHALVAAANAEDAVVEAMVRRLLDLGADPLARNKDAQSILDVAIISRPGCSTKAATQLYETLLSSIQAAAGSESGSFLTTRSSTSGQAPIHAAVVTGNVAAVKALCSRVSPADAAAVLGAPTTTNGVSVVELLATSASSSAAEMANALVAVQAVDKDAYESLRQRHEALQAKHQQQAKDEEAEAAAKREEEEEEEDALGGDEAGAAAGTDGASAALARLKQRRGNAGGSTGGGAAGISRVQQARRARADTAAQRKQQQLPFGHRGGHDGEGGRGGLFGGAELSAPVKVVGVLLLLSLVVSAYSLFFGLGDPSVEAA